MGLFPVFSTGIQKVKIPFSKLVIKGTVRGDKTPNTASKTYRKV